MAGHPRFRQSASFNSGSSSGDSREILVQHLLLKEDDQKLVLELQQRIAGGEDLSDLAVEYSICPSKEEGGMLGWVRKGQMVPEFEEAAFNAPLNKVVKCKTNYGWHLLQVISERYALEYSSNLKPVLDEAKQVLTLLQLASGKNQCLKTLNLRSFMQKCKISASLKRLS